MVLGSDVVTAELTAIVQVAIDYCAMATNLE